MLRSINFLLVFTILWSCTALTACADEKASSPVITELGKQVKEALREYGFPNPVINGLSFSGTITLGTPSALPKSMKEVSQKYSCAIECDIQVLDKTSNSLVCKIKGTFDDIGRTPRTARKYALGKVVKPIFKCIKKKKRQDSQLQNMNDIFKTLEQEEAILKKHIESLSRFVDGVMNNIEQSIGP